MEISLKDHFILQWRKYFAGAELPLTFYYTDKPAAASVADKKRDPHCFICQLSKVRNGESMAFSRDTINCPGGRRYLGFEKTIRPEFEYFLSCGIENRMEGERYIRTPELVRELMKNQKNLDIHGKYIVCKRWDMLEESDTPEVVTFFAKPDVISGLFTLANFDQSEPNSTFTPFGAGCSSVVHYAYLEKDSTRPRAVIGLFDVSARPCVEAGLLTFSVPMVKFVKMIGYMDESFLITGSWEKVRKRIKNPPPAHSGLSL